MLTLPWSCYWSLIYLITSLYMDCASIPWVMLLLDWYSMVYKTNYLHAGEQIFRNHHSKYHDQNEPWIWPSLRSPQMEGLKIINVFACPFFTAVTRLYTLNVTITTACKTAMHHKDKQSTIEVLMHRIYSCANQLTKSNPGSKRPGENNYNVISITKRGLN